ncbi:MAG: 2-hydroxyacyl-CoA dehydratase [Clostridia bacterium]|nr:2-hydroxyacyl-CoA dehydratase [Clostridia bacterium]
MRDLKHLIYFENLLQEANNELVRQAQSEGKLALGYTCYFMPEALLNLPGCFSARLRAPRSSSADIASYYMTNRTCPYGRCLLERAIEGGFNFLDAMLGTETCTVTNRMEENFELLNLNPKENFFVSYLDVPMKKGGRTVEHYESQLVKKVLNPLHEKYGVDISDAAIRKAVEEQNEVNRLVTEIGDYRKLDRSNITGYEFSVIQLVTLTCPHYLILDMLRETAEEMKTREPDEKNQYRIKTVVAGSEIDDPDFIALIEQCGALVVADRFCYGSLPGRTQIEIREGETALRAVTRYYQDTSICPRWMNQELIHDRRDNYVNLVKEYNADGIILEQMKFCEYWSYERVISNILLRQDFGIPVCSIEKEYNNGAFGQLRTRFQAFVENVEFKKLHEKEAAG